MNRVKKEVRRRGVKLKSDYQHLPLQIHPGIYIEDVYFDSETATVTKYYNVDDVQVRLSREGVMEFCNY